MPKLVLIVAHYDRINLSRTKLVKNAGYDVCSASLDDEAMEMLDCDAIDLVVIGRRSDAALESLDSV